MKRLILLSVLAMAVGVNAAAQEPANDTWKPFDYTEHLKTMYKGADMKYAFDNYKPARWKKWQKDLRKELWTTLGLDIIERNCKGFKPSARMLESEELGGYTREHWEIRTEPDVLIPMVILRPRDAKERMPLIITPHGHSMNTEAYAGIYENDAEKAFMEGGDRDIAVQGVRRGFIAIAPTARGFGKTRTRGDIKLDRAYSCAGGTYPGRGQGMGYDADSGLGIGEPPCG